MELFYNPERMSEIEIRETFVAHQWLVDEIISIVKRQPKGAAVQHVVIVAPRGMGKTTLLLMLRLTVLNHDIAKRWQPVLFPEESYSVYDLADLWLEVLDHIASETGEAELHEEAEKLKNSHPDSADLEPLALARIKDWHRKHKKRLLMLVDSLDLILEQIGNEKDNASLRNVLMNDGTMMFVGGSTTFFKEARAYDQPLYNFFKIYNLNGLDSDQIEDLLRRRAKLDGVENFEEILRANRTRLRVLEYFTGGNPRLVLMLYRVITQSEITEVRRGLEKLLDEVTPYYKAKIETLPPQQRKILDQIARISAQTREGLTPTEIAAATRLAVNQVSSQLKRLADDGYVRTANIRGRSSYYTLSEPLYAIWHQMRFSRDARMKMNWLVTFLKGWYDAKELGEESQRLQVAFRNYLSAGREKDARDALEHRRYLMEAIEDQQSRVHTLESIVLGYLELSDVETLQREVLTNPDVSLLSHNTHQLLIDAGLIFKVPIGDKVVPDAHLQSSLHSYLNNLENVLRDNPDLKLAWQLKGVVLVRASRLEEAADAFRRAVKIESDFLGWFSLAEVLSTLQQYEEALAGFDEALGFNEDSFEAHLGRCRCLAELNRLDEGLYNIDRALSIEPNSAAGWSLRGTILVEMEKIDEAFKSFEQAVALDPNSYDYLFHKVETLIFLDRIEEALRGIDQMLELEPESADAHLLRAFFGDSSSDNFIGDVKYALALNSSEHRTLIDSYGKPIKIIVSVMAGEIKDVRSDWEEFLRYTNDLADQEVWLEPASDVVIFTAKAGHWELAKELITSSNLEEQLFPLARALDYLLEGDKNSIEKLSPEVREFVNEIVSTLERPSTDERNTGKSSRTPKRKKADDKNR